MFLITVAHMVIKTRILYRISRVSFAEFTGRTLCSIRLRITIVDIVPKHHSDLRYCLTQASRQATPKRLLAREGSCQRAPVLDFSNRYL